MNTRTFRSTLISSLGVALALLVSDAAAVSYSFSILYDSNGPFDDFGVPALNNSGTVAFSAGVDTGVRGIFTGSGGPTTTIVDTSGPFDNFPGYSLNNGGTVVFSGSLSPFETAAIYTGSGGPLTTIFTPTGFEDSVVTLSINDHGTVAMLVELSSEQKSGIYTGSGGPLTPLYEVNDNAIAFGDLVPFNNSGTVAFLAPGGVDGIVTGNGGPLTTIADSSGPFLTFTGGDEVFPAVYRLNDSGTVAFLVPLDTGGSGIFTGSGGPTSTIVDHSGPFAFFREFSINNSDTVAMLAHLDTGGLGIFIGPDPLADEVISLGDPLFGSTVVDLLIRDESLNDTGQLAFFFELADGRTGIALADPRAIPEPGTLVLLGLGLIGLGVVRRRAGSAGAERSGPPQPQSEATMRTGTLVAAVLTVSVGNAVAAPYSFSNLYDSSGPFNSFEIPSLNNSGTVAFGAGVDTGGSGIFTGNGGPTTTIVDTSGPFDNFPGYSLNNGGTVAFQAFLGSSEAFRGGIFTGSGGPRTTIVTVQAEDFVQSLSINDNGTVAFLADLQEADFQTRIFTGSGGPVRTLYDAPLVNFVPFNDSGTVAFIAFLDPSEHGIVIGSGGPTTTIARPTTTIATSSGPFSAFFSGDENPQAAYALNDSGTVAFVVGLDTGEFDFGLFTGSGGLTTTIADNSGPFSFFGGGAGEHPGFSLNNSGTVAFRAFLDTGAFGIFTGPDPLADEVIRLGDPLFGSTVTDLSIGHESLNDIGQIAFSYQLADGRSGIARADPLGIPEPGTLTLLGLGLLGLGVVRRRLGPAGVDEPTRPPQPQSEATMRKGTLVAAILTLSVGNAAAAPYRFSNLYDSSGPFNSFETPSLNNSGTVAFGAGLDTGDSGIFTGTGGTTTTIVDTSGPFEPSGSYSLNDGGTVAFRSSPTLRSSIYTGSGGPLTTIFTFRPCPLARPSVAVRAGAVRYQPAQAAPAATSPIR